MILEGRPESRSKPTERGKPAKSIALRTVWQQRAVLAERMANHVSRENTAFRELKRGKRELSLTKEKRQGSDGKRLPNHVRNAYDPKASEQDHSNTVRFFNQPPNPPGTLECHHHVK